MPIHARGHWSTRLAFILATTGAAVGLGNIWKFPYMAGDNGGSAFVLVYLLCVILIGLPVMLSEMAIGRRAQLNPVNALKKIAAENKSSAHWQYLGWLGAVTLLLVLSFYSVVAGWAFQYLWLAASNHLHGLNAQAINQLWQNFLSQPQKLLLWHSVFMLLTLWIVAHGVNQGLERASRIMMPLLFAILIVLDGYGTGTGGFGQAAHFLFHFDLHKITPVVVIAALGHAFFTLAIGAGCMLVYGSYLKHHVHLGSAVVTIAILDVLVAILAGLAIFSLIFANHLPVAGGPGLMFQILPIAFAKMEGGQFFGSLFFLLLLFAALTSSISLAEPLVNLLEERQHISRRMASIIVGVVAWGLGLVSLLSFNVWQHVKVLGHWDFFTAITDLATNILLPLGGIGFALFAGFVMTKKSTQDELGFRHAWVYYAWRFLVRYAAPIGISLILLGALTGYSA